MTAQDAKQPTPKQRRRAALILKLSGLSDIGLGLAMPFLGPDLLGLDSFTSALIGGGLVMCGIAVLVFTRWQFGPKPADRHAASTVTRNR